MSIEKHKDSAYILFLRGSRVADSAELRLAYSLGEIYQMGYTHCWVCGEHKGAYMYDDPATYKDHYEAAHSGKTYFFSNSGGNLTDDYVTLPVDFSKMIGLFDQFIIFFKFDELRRRKKKNQSPNFQSIFGGCITKIMKDYNIPMKFFKDYMNLNNVTFERYTTAYWKSMPEKDRPGWMKGLL